MTPSETADPPTTDTVQRPQRSGASGAAVVLACVVITVGVAAGIAYNLLELPGLRGLEVLGDYYRIDLDVYRIGGGVFASGAPLYGEMPPTALGNTLPFTYPPIAAVIFSLLSMISLYWAGIVVTALSLVMLATTIVLTLVSLGYSPKTLLMWAAGGVFAVSMILEPVFSTLDYGQINIILMLFVAADCLPKKTPWPRGVMIGFVAAVKLTPAVFVLFFLIRKDFRSAVVSGISFAVFTAIGFIATWSDSVEYWTSTLFDSSRIGTPAYPANQSITGVLARLGLDGSLKSVLWIGLSCVLLALAVVAMRKAFASDLTALALGVNAVFGLLVSPVSWSHHWVWVVPLMVALATSAYQQKKILVMALVGVGIILFHFAPHWRLSVGRSSGLGWPLWDQLAASSYVWWGIAAMVIIACSTWTQLALVSGRRS